MSFLSSEFLIIYTHQIDDTFKNLDVFYNLLSQYFLSCQHHFLTPKIMFTEGNTQYEASNIRKTTSYKSL